MGGEGGRWVGRAMPYCWEEGGVAPRPPYCWEGGVLPRCCCCSTIPYWPARYWLEARLPTKFFKFKMVKEESSGTRNLPLPIDLWGNFSTYALDTNKKNNGHINRSLYKKLYFFRMHAHKRRSLEENYRTKFPRRSD